MQVYKTFAKLRRIPFCVVPFRLSATDNLPAKQQKKAVPGSLSWEPLFSGRSVQLGYLWKQLRKMITSKMNRTKIVPVDVPRLQPQ